MSNIKENHKQRLQDALESEFCPPLDTTLVAAFAAECEAKELENDFDGVLAELRESLGGLAAAAVVDVQEADSFGNESGEADAVTSEEKSSLFDPSSETSSVSSSSVALYSTVTTPTSIGHPLNTPIDFLRTSFPNLAVARLQELLKDGYRTRNSIDMEKIIEQLLNEEYMRELAERGVDPDSSLSDVSEEEGGAWILVDRRRSKDKPTNLANTRQPTGNATTGTVKKKGKPKSKTITLVDVRQSQHRPIRAREMETGSRAAPDLWSQISSLSAYLSDLLPPNPPSFFASFFHSPDFKAPAAAVRASIESLVLAKDRRMDNHKQDSDEFVHTTALFSLLDLISSAPYYDNLDSIDRVRILEDAQLALEATDGASDVALDIVVLLRDLDMDGTGVMQMGVYHSPALVPLPASPVPSKQSPVPSYGVRLDASASSVVEQLAIGAKKSTNNGGWQTVKPRPPKPPLVHPLATHIPAYNRTPGNLKGKGKVKRGTGNTFGMGGKGDVGELRLGASTNLNWRADTRRQISDCRRRRDEALRDASRYWQQGNVKSRGGEIALYFAERARALQEQSKNLKLDAARRLVDSKRIESESGVTIDLHYTTVNESIQIVKEVLEEGWVRHSCPLNIITGKGSHSLNGVSVLGPAIKRALDAEGWIVGRSEAGLIVRGREMGRR